jgi:hypothetical protein
MVGVQVNVLLLPQSCPTVQAPFFAIHYLYWYGAMPPVAVAVRVMGVPASWGEAGVGVTLVTVRPVPVTV